MFMCNFRTLSIVCAAYFEKKILFWLFNFLQESRQRRNDALKGYHLKQLSMTGNRGGHKVRRVKAFFYAEIICSPWQQQHCVA